MSAKLINVFPHGVTHLLQLLDLLEEPLDPPDAIFECVDLNFESPSYVSSSAIVGRTFLIRACGWTTFAFPLFSLDRALFAHLLAGFVRGYLFWGGSANLA